MIACVSRSLASRRSTSPPDSAIPRKTPNCFLSCTRRLSWLRDLSSSGKHPRRFHLGLNADLLKVRIHTDRSLPAFGNRPYYQRLATAHVPSREDSGDRGHVVLVGGDVATVVELNTKLLDHPVAYRTEEAHCNQDEIRVNGEL